MSVSCLLRERVLFKKHKRERNRHTLPVPYPHPTRAALSGLSRVSARCSWRFSRFSAFFATSLTLKTYDFGGFSYVSPPDKVSFQGGYGLLYQKPPS